MLIDFLGKRLTHEGIFLFYDTFFFAHFALKKASCQKMYR
jgi:hypothetical protein